MYNVYCTYIIYKLSFFFTELEVITGYINFYNKTTLHFNTALTLIFFVLTVSYQSIILSKYLKIDLVFKMIFFESNYFIAFAFF